MTRELYNKLIKEAQKRSQPSERLEVEQPFSCGTMDTVFLYHVDHYTVKSVNGEFIGIVDNHTQEFFTYEKTTVFDFADYDENELEKLIKEAKAEAVKRQQMKIQDKIDGFNQAWQMLKQFPKVRMRVTIKGKDGTHQHCEIGDLELQVLPIR